MQSFYTDHNISDDAIIELKEKLPPILTTHFSELIFMKVKLKQHSLDVKTSCFEIFQFIQIKWILL